MDQESAAGSSAIVVFIVTIALLVASSIATVSGQVSLSKDITHAKVIKFPRNRQTNTHPLQPLPASPGDLKHTSSSSTPSPTDPTLSPGPWSSMEVNVTLGGTAVHLNLREDTKFEPDVPVLELYTDASGKEKLQRAKIKKAEYSVYHDQDKEADFLVYPEKDENGTSLYKMEGLVHLDGNVYDLKTTGRKLNQRNRRETSQTHDDVIDDVSHDDSSEERQEEEMVVIKYPDLKADRRDSLPSPNPVRKGKVMTEAILNPIPFVVLSRLPPSSSEPTTPTPPSPALPLPRTPRRRRREVIQDVYVDVVAVADYGVYRSWYNRSTKTTAEEKKMESLENIRRYYAFVMHGVSILYNDITTLSYRIHVKVSSIIVATTPTSSAWTESRRVSAPVWDEVNANDALQAFSSWAVSTDLLPKYDHLMLFSGYDLTRNNSEVKSDTITGLAYTGTLCDTTGKATSIVEDLGGFQCIVTAAHELGHGLSAEHDGSSNRCSSLDRYIMSAGTYPVTADNKLNPWKFSTCSVNYFNSFFTRYVPLALYQTCLYNALTPNITIPDVTSLLAGQMYDVDEQCRQVYGPLSRMCRGSEFGVPQNVCTEMFCFDPTTSSTCYQLVAARGTTCGNHKWCEGGQCVYNSDAPPANESCVYGDQPGLAFNNKTCAVFVSNFSGYCYQEVVRTRCCASCAKYYRLVKGCEYGDRLNGCTVRACPMYTQEDLTNCCGTCSYGSTFTTTTTTSKATTITTTTPTMSTAVPAVSRTISTAGTPSTTFTKVNCVDGNVTFYGNYTCSSYVSYRPFACYNASFISHCCDSCRKAFRGVQGCEYGDHPECDVVVQNPSDCVNKNLLCCETCASSSAGQAVTTHVTVYVIGACVALALPHWTQNFV